MKQLNRLLFLMPRGVVVCDIARIAAIYHGGVSLVDFFSGKDIGQQG